MQRKNGKSLKSRKRENTLRVVVLRWGHRPQRDARLTSHVALAARAFGAAGLILSDTKDPKIKDSIERVTREWGGPFFFDMGIPWKRAIDNWRAHGGVVVHLTAYGENIETSNAIERIKESGKDVLVIVGSQKVPGAFFSETVSDLNVAIGNQPHSECAGLAVFLDRLFDGKELTRRFQNARIKILPRARGKKILSQETV